MYTFIYVYIHICAYKKVRTCHLCLMEKKPISLADPTKTLNKRNEIVAKCRHRDKVLLKNWWFFYFKHNLEQSSPACNIIYFFKSVKLSKRNLRIFSSNFQSSLRNLAEECTCTKHCVREIYIKKWNLSVLILIHSDIFIHIWWAEIRQRRKDNVQKDNLQKDNGQNDTVTKRQRPKTQRKKLQFSK